MYILLLAIIYLSFISLGLPDSLLGSGWPKIYQELNVPVSSLGILSMIVCGCTIISSLLYSTLHKKIKTKTIVITSILISSLALIGFSFSNKFYMLILLSIPYGLSAGAIDAALNNYISLHYTSRHMSWLHCFWGVGCIISPFIMSYTLTYYNWNKGFFIVGLIQLGIGFVVLLTNKVWNINEEKEEESSKKQNGMFDALKVKGVPFILIGFFAYCAFEATTMGWASTYMVKYRGIDIETGAKLASLFYIGITTGRFISGFVSEKIGDKRMIIIGSIIIAVGASLLILPINDNILAIIGYIIVGLGCAPIYPSIMHSTPTLFGSENSPTIIGVEMASAYTGSTFVPPIFGYLGSILGYGILPIFQLTFGALMITMVMICFNISKNHSV